MRYLALCFFALLLVGCVIPPVQTPDEPITPPKTCRIVQTDQPVTTQECTNYTKTTTSCNDRPLNYSTISFSKNTLCIVDGPCAGKPLESCSECSNAMMRCILTLQSNEDSEAGTITVGANFTLPGGAFLKEPISKTFNQGTSHAFDFYQIYGPGKPINSADCDLYVIGTPTVNECIDITKIESDCKSVTKIEKIQTEVCT